jgi:hypothetical protein
MTAIIVSVLVSLLGLLLLFVFFTRVDGTSAPTHASKQSHSAIAGLSAVCGPDLEVLLGNSDYLKLRSRPELKVVCDRFRRDRRRIVLMWLGELQSDLKVLWKFRRFLAGNGLPVTLREEAAVASTALMALLYLKIVQASVVVFGPFAAFQALRNAKLRVEEVSTLGAALLAAVPDPRKEELAERWAEQRQILRAG